MSLQKIIKNMRLLLFVTILILPFFAFGQFSFSSDWNNCGTWEEASRDTTNWTPIQDASNHWVYKKPYLEISNTITLEYAPCGNGRPSRYIKERICPKTGFKQKRFLITYYKYVPKPKTEFEKIEEKFRN